MTEAICLVIDTGATASQRPPGGRSFLEAALECASLLVERRLFAESRDEFAVVMFGSEDTNNNLSYENINVLERGMAPADWELVSFLREHISGTNMEPDWMDGVIVALDFLKNASENKKYSALKIVLFSEVGCPSSIDQDQLEFIINGIKNMDNVDFSFFGPEWADNLFDDLDPDSQNGDANESQSQDQDQPSSSRVKPSKGSWKKQLYKSKPKTRIQEESETFLKALVNVTEGFSGSLNLAVENFIFKNRKGKKSMPWKVCFTLGPDIRISTTGYVLVRRENPKQWKRCLARGGDEEELKPETSYVREKESKVEEVEQEDVVMGYRYGQEIVSLTEQDEAMAKFDGGPKSMSLFGFLSRDQVRIQDLVGDGCMVFMPTEADGNSQRAWTALIQAMLEMDMVMVVRKVYNKSSAPRLGALVPEYNEDGELILCHVELPFSEDIKDLQLPPLPSVTEQQEEVMDNLIEMSMLCEEDENGDAVNDDLPVSTMLNPNTQYMYQALRHRATNPGRILPTPAEHILDLLKINPRIEEALGGVHEDIKEVFKTKVNEKMAHKRKRQDELFIDDSKKFRVDDSAVTEVGPINPVDDFRYLLAHSVTSNTTYDSLAQQMETVVVRLLEGKYSSNMTTKIVASLSALREESCHRQRPELYNNFVKKVKEKCEGENEKILLEIAEANLGLIADSEVRGGVEEREAAEFLMPPDSDRTVDKDDFDDSDDILAAL